MNETERIMNETERIQAAHAVIEIVRKRLTFRGPSDKLIETNVVDSLVVLPKDMQKTFFAAVGDEKYKWVQAIDGKPVQAFHADDLLVID